jgi:hypothetical protein
MRWLSNPTKWNTTLIIIFFAFWIWTEVTEYYARAEHMARVDKFMNKGDRFTLERGIGLEEDIGELQERISILIEVEAPSHPELEEYSND